VALLIWEFTRPVCPKILLEGEQALPSNGLYSLRRIKVRIEIAMQERTAA
jgi:hypothetical protein